MQKTVVITGASSGIGAATARRFADRGWRVYNLSRKPGGDARAEFIATDVADTASVEAAFAEIGAARGALDILVNNAGMGISGAVEFTDIEEARRLFDVNFFGQVRCAQAAIPLLRKKHGRIVNVSSAAALFAIPFQTFYSAGKSATNAFTLALDSELKAFGIRAVAVMPGDVRTNFTSSREKSDAGETVYGGAIARSVAVMEKDEKNGMPPEAVARAIYRAATVRRPRPLRCVGAQYSLFAFLFKILPVRVVNGIVAILYIR